MATEIISEKISLWASKRPLDTFLKMVMVMTSMSKSCMGLTSIWSRSSSMLEMAEVINLLMYYKEYWYMALTLEISSTAK